MKKSLVFIFFITTLLFLTSCEQKEDDTEKTLYFDSESYTLVSYDEATKISVFESISGEPLTIEEVIENERYIIMVGQESFRYELEGNQSVYTVMFPDGKEEVWSCGSGSCGSSTGADFNFKYPNGPEFKEIFKYYEDDYEDDTQSEDESNDRNVKLIIYAVVLIPFGLVCLLAPDFVWEMEHLFKRWMYKDRRPSQGFYTYCKISGSLMLLGGIISILLFFFI